MLNTTDYLHMSPQQIFNTYVVFKPDNLYLHTFHFTIQSPLNRTDIDLLHILYMKNHHDAVLIFAPIDITKSIRVGFFFSELHKSKHSPYMNKYIKIVEENRPENF